MVTNWVVHWDNPNNDPYYSLSTLKGRMSKNKLIENTPTLFINRNKFTKEIEGAWEGTVSDFTFDKDKRGKDIIRFKYKLEKSLVCPPEYATYAEGWHLDEGNSSKTVGVDVQVEVMPPFFKTVIETDDWNEFEGLCYKLLKLLGIHEIYTFEKQRGKPDGFFKIGSLAVVYDATLETGFETSKKEQIRNYCNQLESGFLEYQDGTVNVRDCSKAVWIITQGKSRRITKVDNVSVKEITVLDLIRVYLERIERNLDEEQLVNSLETLAQ